MKKCFLMMVLLVMGAVCADAQVEIKKFKFYVANLRDWEHKQLEMRVKVTGERSLKYLHVYFSPVNEVGDAIVDHIRGGVNANVKHTKFHHVYATGPLEAGKSYTKHFGPYFFSGKKKPTAFPSHIVLDYMGGGSDTISITKENIGVYFPGTKWMDVDYESGFQPAN